MIQYNRPLPTPDELSRPFWAATRRHVLLLQHCDNCGCWVHPPRPVCRRCRTRQFSRREVNGSGSVYCFGVIEHVTDVLGYSDLVPYVAGLVELDIQSRLLFHTRFVGCSPNDVHIGMRVAPEFDDVTTSITLVNFAPALAIRLQSQTGTEIGA
jgi:uncharacterized OB-fold protein